jgi:hypothetical protein
MWQNVKKSDFFNPSWGQFCSSISALFFFTVQCYGLCYRPSASAVLYPEDLEDPSNPPFPSSNEFQLFVLPRFFSPVLVLKNGMERSANQRKSISVLAVF